MNTGAQALSIEERKVVLGFRLPTDNRAAFCVLMCGALTSSLGFAVLQEGVIRTRDFHYPALMTAVTTSTHLLCGICELRRSHATRHGRLREFAVLASLSYSGTALTNHALGYLNYATRIVFKSAKLLPVMIFSVCIVGRRYDTTEWFCAILLVFGVFQFAVGDATSHPTYALKGILLMTTAIALDSICSNYEERRFFRKNDACTTQEVVCFSSLFGTIYSILYLAYCGELNQNMKDFCHSHPLAILSMVCFSILGYFSITFVLAIIKYYGAPEAEFVKSLRKVLSILLSFTIYPKKMNQNYVRGTCAVTISVLYLLHHKHKRRSKHGMGSAV